MLHPERKPMRLKGFDYSNNGAYLITICTKDRKPLLSSITGEEQRLSLSEYGRIAERHIQSMSHFYSNISLETYIIMPNHIHLLLLLNDMDTAFEEPRQSVSQFVATFKRLCDREYHKNIWQRSFYDRIIDSEDAYEKAWIYTQYNYLKWSKDQYYVE